MSKLDVITSYIKEGGSTSYLLAYLQNDWIHFNTIIDVIYPLLSLCPVRNDYCTDGVMLISISSLQAFLTGCSAGGLATFIHCDDFRALLPKESSVKCLSDGGFFLDVYVFRSPLTALNFS
jgi:hypothetical protein